MQEKVKKGTRVCLKCNKKFKSEDMLRNRICPECNQINKELYLPRVGHILSEFDDYISPTRPTDI